MQSEILYQFINLQVNSLSMLLNESQNIIICIFLTSIFGAFLQWLASRFLQTTRITAFLFPAIALSAVTLYLFIQNSFIILFLLPAFGIYCFGFRKNILVFIFLNWSILIGAGIVIGAYLIVLLFSLMMSIWLFLYHKTSKSCYDVEVLCFDHHCEQMVWKEMKLIGACEMHEKHIDEQGIKIKLYLTCKDITLVDKLDSMKGIEKISLVLMKDAVL